jgi:hypothetical protein
MSTDCVLVTAQAPSQDDLHIGAAHAVSLGRLTGYQLDGSWDDDPLVTLVAPSGGLLDDDEPLVLQVGRPRHLRVADAVDLTADLFVQAPADDTGRVWLTDLTMRNPAGEATAERHFLALMTIAAAPASARGGYLVLTSGETTIVPLDGVAVPEPLSLTDLPERPVPIPAAEVFVGAALDASGQPDAGWQLALAYLDRLCERMPGSRPDHVLADEWVPFDPTPAAEGTAPSEPPHWWPQSQSLFASAGQFSWLVSGVTRPAQSQLLMLLGKGPFPDQASPALGQGLVGLAGGPLDYGYAHPWHPDEPWTSGGGPRMTGDGPFFMLTPRDLDEGLPNLYWLQILGPRWVQRLGADRIAGTPAHRVAQVGDQHWLLQLAPSLSAVTQDYPAFTFARSKAVEHLGREHFPFLDGTS